MALFNPYQMVGANQYAVLESERDIPSSGNTYTIGTGPNPSYGGTGGSLVSAGDVYGSGGGGEPYQPPAGLMGWATDGSFGAPPPQYGAPYPGASPGGYSLGNSSGAPAAASYWGGPGGNTLINPAAAQPALLQPSGYNYSTGGAPVPFGYGSSAANQPTIESAGGGGAGGAAGGGGSGAGWMNALAVAPTALGVANRFELLDPIKEGISDAWDATDIPNPFSGAGDYISGLFGGPTTAPPIGSLENMQSVFGDPSAATGYDAWMGGVGGTPASAPPVPGTWGHFTGGLGAIGAPFMGAVAAQVGKSFLGLDGRGGILHTLGLIGDERDEEARLRALTVGDAVTAAARGQMPIQAAIEAISPGTDNPSNMRRLEELKAAAEATRDMQATDQRRIDAENEFRNAAAYQQTQNLNTVSEIEQLVKEGILDSEDERTAVAKIKGDLMASAGMSGIETSEIEKYKQKASQYRTAMTSGEGKWPVLAQAQKEYKQAGQLAPWMKYLPVNLQKEVMSSHVSIQEGEGGW